MKATNLVKKAMFLLVIKIIVNVTNLTCSRVLERDKQY